MTLRLGFIPNPHLDLFWLGSYLTCLDRGAELLGDYIDVCIADEDATLLIDSVIFAQALVERQPDRTDDLRRLTQEGRVQIGAAYIDRWENLVLGESHIRNYALGQRWCRETLGYDADLACHPDIPGMATQMAQVCRGLGIRHYVTARKIYHEGRVWRLRAPDGSSLLVLQWPKHYFVEGDLMDDFDKADLEHRYPAGSVLFAGGAGDLGSPADFLDVQGRDLASVIEGYRSSYPDADVGYGTPGRVLEAYDPDSREDGLAEVDLPIPSVWGVMPDEEAIVFRSIREVERRLLEAETAAACAAALGASLLPVSAREWQGTYYERAFYRRDDTPPTGFELDELWRMHLFTQDHNGGGEEGALSSFQKRVRQDRCLAACDEVLAHAIKSAQGQLIDSGLIIFNSTLASWRGVASVDEATGAGEILAETANGSKRVQRSTSALGHSRVHLRVDHTAPVGFTALSRAELTQPVEVTPVETAATSDQIAMRSGRLEVVVDQATGDATIRDAVRGRVLQDGVGGVCAVREVGNDVTMATDEDSREAARVLSVNIAGMGPLFSEVVIRRQVAEAEWTTLIRLYASEDRVDLETGVRWWGAKGMQVRMRIGGARDASAISYGTPFHGSPWDAVPSDAGPRQPDEITPQDYSRYREIQHWLHMDDGVDGMTVTTQHPGIRFDPVDGIEAVLLRTPASCGDPRFYWANAGEHEWSFTFRPGERAWQAAGASQLGDHDWRVPSLHATEPAMDPGPPADERVAALSMLRVEDPVAPGAYVTSVAPADDRILARILNPGTDTTRVTLGGPLTARGVAITDMHGRAPRAVPLTSSGFEVSIEPWQLQTVSLGPVVATGATQERNI